MIRKTILSFSLIWAFSVYVLFVTPDVPSPEIIPRSLALSSSTPLPTPSSTQHKIAIAAPPPKTVPSTPAPAPKTATTSTVIAPPQQPVPPQPVPVPQPPPAPPKPAGMYNDGTYTGSVADAYYGNVQVQATIQNAKLTAVQFLQYPSDRSTSRSINGQAMPFLIQEALAAQSASVDIVSGATETSMAFQQSLATALAAARA